MAEEVNLLPIVSVIMPAYNAECYIAESIESVISQTFKNWELIIIDDGSTDNTKEIILPFLLRDNRISYIFQENGKQGKARNGGIKQSVGTYIAFLDADDLWHPKKLERQLQCINEVHADLLFSDCFSFKDNLNQELFNFQTVTGLICEEQGFDLFLKLNRIPILTVLVKKECLLHVGCFDERKPIQNAEDYQLWLKLLLAHYKFYGMPDILAYYRTHSSQSTSTDPLSTLSAIYAIQSLKCLPPSFEVIRRNNLKTWIRRFFRINPPTDKKQFINIIQLYFVGGKVPLTLMFHLLIRSFGIRFSGKVFLRLLNYSWS